MVFNTTFNNISVISWQSVLLMEETRVPEDRNESGKTSLKSNSTHHFFRNACTKSGSLRFSQFCGCWLILSVYIIVSFDFPFVRLFGEKNSWHFWLLYLYTFSLYENASLIIFSAETEYISTRYWYRNINWFLFKISKLCCLQHL
jgi:hypothetical protein